MRFALGAVVFLLVLAIACSPGDGGKDPGLAGSIDVAGSAATLGAQNDLIATATALAAAHTPPSETITPPAPTEDAGPSVVATAESRVRANRSLAQLATLVVKGRAPKTGYSRDQFGPAWEDVDHNGCDTRNDILRRDLEVYALQEDSNCIIANGALLDPYTGRLIPFLRGETTSSAVQIDHVVALADAWQKGAFQWDAKKRMQFANDPQELLAVDGPTNQAKGDGDAATWLPPNKPFRCTYIEIQVSVKAKYGLW